MPAVAAANPGLARVLALKRLATWRDLGAGVGPLVVGLLLPLLPTSALYSGAAALLAASALALAGRAGGGDAPVIASVARRGRTPAQGPDSLEAVVWGARLRYPCLCLFRLEAPGHKACVGGSHDRRQVRPRREFRYRGPAVAHLLGAGRRQGPPAASTPRSMIPMKSYRPKLEPASQSVVLLRWNMDIRESAVLGLVAAGGIGVALDAALDNLYPDHVGLILAVVVATEITTSFIRSRIL